MHENIEPNRWNLDVSGEPRTEEQSQGWEVESEPDYCPFDQLYWYTCRKKTDRKLLGKSVYLICTVAFPEAHVETDSLPAEGDIITLTSITK